MIAAGSAVPSTPMELVSRLTEQAVTPGTCPTAFSTRALQAAQLMPVTLYCSICFTTFYFISFWSVSTSSSITSSLPSRRSRATQEWRWAAMSSRLKALSAACTAADWVRMSVQ